MDINQLLDIVKKKIETNINLEKIVVEDKTFLHKKHENHQKGKYHLKIFVQSKDLANNNKLDNFKLIHKILEKEIKHNIHSLQLKIN